MRQGWAQVLCGFRQVLPPSGCGMLGKEGTMWFLLALKEERGSWKSWKSLVWVLLTAVCIGAVMQEPPG